MRCATSRRSVTRASWPSICDWAFARRWCRSASTRRYERFGRVILPAVSVRADLAACHAELGTFAEGRAIARDAVEIAEAVGHHTSLMMAYRALGLLLLRQGDVGALSLLERAV